MPSLPVVSRPLPYENRLARRDIATIELAVIHCTELPDLAAARGFAEVVRYQASGTGNAGHYYIDRDGLIEQWVALDRIAHHVRGCNDFSLGIELVNRGRYPDWLHTSHQVMSEQYPAAQIDALCALLSGLCGQVPGLRRIAGHEDLDTERVPATDDPAVTVRRKLDPGPLFPWPRVLAAVPLARDGRC